MTSLLGLFQKPCRNYVRKLQEEDFFCYLCKVNGPSWGKIKQEKRSFLTPSLSFGNRDRINCFLCVCAVGDFPPHFCSLVYRKIKGNGLLISIHFIVSLVGGHLYIFLNMFQSSYIQKE